MSPELVVVVVLAAGWLVIERRIWPTKVCGRCRGAKETSPGDRRRRPCGKCGGTGRVRRWFSG